MGLLDFFKKKEQALEEYELPVEIEESAVTNIVIEKLENYASTDKIIQNIKKGNIVLVKIKDLKENNLDELKQCISKLRTAAASFGGDIAGVGDEFVIVTPSKAAIHRGL